MSELKHYIQIWEYDPENLTDIGKNKLIEMLIEKLNDLEKKQK